MESFSEETMLASLRDIRLPSDAAGGALADILASVGLAALAAALCVALLRLFLAPRVQTHARTLADDVQQLRALPEAEQRIALLHILKNHAPERFQSLSRDLYEPERVTLDELNAEVSRLV